MNPRDIFIPWISLGIILNGLFGGCESSNKTASSSNALTIDQIDSQASKIYNLRSLLIYNGYEPLLESYYAKYPTDSLDHIRSVTKSIMGLLIGIAIEKGFITSIDQPISQFLKGKYSNYRDKYHAVNLKHLLTMSSGLNWDESKVSEFNQWVTSSDPVMYVLRRDIVNSPGSKFEYNSGASHLLSLVITEATGQSTLEFARENLFEPLDIVDSRWQKLGPYYNGGAGLELKPSDMIKIGQLMCGQGQYKGKQVINNQWINESIDYQLEVKGSLGYGYLWWVDGKRPERVAAAIGFGGQNIMILPDRGYTAVTTCNWQNLKGGATEQQQQIGKFMLDTIYPYMVNEE